MQQIIEYIQDFLEIIIAQECVKEYARHKNLKEDKKQSIEAKIRQNYQVNDWIDDVKLAIDGLEDISFSLATHIAKGIHSSSKSSNILSIHNDKPIPNFLVGSHSIPNPHIDINNNNTAVHIAKFSKVCQFLNIDVKDKKFYRLILDDTPEMVEFFEQKIGSKGLELLQKHLRQTIDQPSISGIDKQLLFPVNDGQYHTIYPSYPSSLAYEAYLKIIDIKYSTHNKQARADRKNKQKDSFDTYADITNLAVVKLGGTKPLNVSTLNKERNGRTYLLPSMPPKFTASASVSFSKSASNLFDTKGFNYHLHELIRALSKNIANKINNINVRDRRDEIIDEILMVIFELVKNIQEHRLAGWSDDYQLSHAQKRWLDPKNPKYAPPDDDADTNTDFNTQEQTDDWQAQIIQDFAHWLQNRLKRQLKDHAHQFGESEHHAWATYIEQAIAQSKRLAQGVF